MIHRRSLIYRRSPGIVSGFLCLVLAAGGLGAAEYTGGGADPSDWSDPDNWGGGNPRNEEAIIVGPFDVTAANDIIEKFELGDGATLLVQGNVRLSVTGGSPSFVGAPEPVGNSLTSTLEITDDGSVRIQSNDVFLGNCNQCPGVISLTGNASFSTGGGLIMGRQDEATLSLEDRSSFTSDRLQVGSENDLGFFFSINVVMGGGTLTARSFDVGPQEEVNVEMTGGTMDLGSISWLARTGCFTFSGGTITLDGNQESVIDECWFNHGGANATYNSGTDKTTITAGGVAPACSNVPEDKCPDPCLVEAVEYSGLGVEPTDWSDLDNWDPSCAPTGKRIKIVGPFDVEAETDSVVSLLLGGQGILTVDGSKTLTITHAQQGERQNPSLLGTGDGQGTLEIAGNGTVRSLGSRGFYPGNTGAGEGHIVVRENGTYDSSRGNPLEIAHRGDCSLTIQDNGRVIVSHVSFGWGGQLGFSPDTTVTMTGGRLIADLYHTRPFQGVHIVEMMGGSMELQELIWEAPTGSSFQFSGGTITIGGDQRSIPNQPWFEGPAVATYDRSRDETIIRPVVGVGPFIRGDCDLDGVVSGVVSDAVFQLNFSFLEGMAPRCNAACDSNGDGSIAGDVGDAVHTLNYNFLEGLPPVDPFPDCQSGMRPIDAELGCETPFCPKP